MPQLLDAMDASVERNKTPLLIDCTMRPDSTDSLSPLETFYAYAKGFEVVEMKKVSVICVPTLTRYDDVSSLTHAHIYVLSSLTHAHKYVLRLLTHAHIYVLSTHTHVHMCFEPAHTCTYTF